MTNAFEGMTKYFKSDCKKELDEIENKLIEQFNIAGDVKEQIYKRMYMYDSPEFIPETDLVRDWMELRHCYDDWDSEELYMWKS